MLDFGKMRMCSAEYPAKIAFGLTLTFLASLVLEPHPDDPRRQPRHLRELLLHQRVRPGVGVVAALEYVELLLGQYGPHPTRTVTPLVLVLTCESSFREAFLREISD